MSSLPEPSLIIEKTFTKEICDEILIELDGWQIIDGKDVESETSSKPFLDIEDENELRNIGRNKKVTRSEVEHFYHKSFKEALNDTNRFDINDLDSTLSSFFIDGVIKLTASNLWLKYNTSVTVNNDEGVIDYGQGGKLYKKYQKIIKKFVRSELIGLSSL